jgi:hypothetical protein
MDRGLNSIHGRLSKQKWASEIPWSVTLGLDLRNYVDRPGWIPLCGWNNVEVIQSKNSTVSK